MKSVTLLSLVFSLCVTISLAEVAQNATYMCFFDGVQKRLDMSIVKGTNDPEILKVFGREGVVPQECVISYDVGRFNITIDPINNYTCGVQPGTTINSTGDGYTFTVTTSSAEGAITVYDAKYVIECEFDVINTEVTITVDPTVIGNGVVATGTAIAETETVDMKIVQFDSPYTAKPSVDFGDKVKLMASLVKRGIAGSATGMAIHDCSAVNSLSAVTKAVSLIAADGCTPAGLGLYVDDLGFTSDTNTPSLFTTLSPTFKAFILSDGTSTIAFRCNATFCYDDDTGCEKSCSRQARKKRDAGSEPETREVVALLTVGGQHLQLATEKNEQNEVKNTIKQEMAACTEKANVVGMAVLGAILALTVLVAVGFFVVIMRSRAAAPALSAKGMSSSQI